MWQSHFDVVRNESTHRFAISRDGRSASYADVLNGWRNDADFGKFFNQVLAQSKFAAFRWETPPATSKTMSQPFEFVLLNSPALSRPPDPADFQEHLTTNRSVIAFPNLRGDAHLVVPCPLGPHEHYGHLAAFVRHAPAEQQAQFWNLVGDTMASRLGSEPVWLSTAGMGVPWLQVRLDSRPKYYGHLPYKAVPGSVKP